MVISVGVCWFSMNINRKFFIFACNYGIKECKSPVVFMFKGELYGRVNRVQGVMECCYSVLLNDGEAIIDKAFPGLGRHRCCFDCHFFDFLIAIFSRIRREAGQTALKLARRLEKSTYRLEAHHSHLRFTHRAIDHQWTPKSLRFRPPSKHPIFRRIMEKASKQCMKARITLCHEQINNLEKVIKTTICELSNILPNNTLIDFTQFLTTRSISVKKTINDRHMKKFANLQSEYDKSSTAIDKSKWVINISSKPLTNAERQILERGPKFAPTPNYIPYKNIVAEIEFSIRNLPEECQESIRTSTANILNKSPLPARNTTLEERKALKELKRDKSRVITKADKGNCFVVID